MDERPSAADARERAEVDRVRRIVTGQLAERAIALTGRETDDEIEALQIAVEDFEAARARLGGDSFTNSLDSSRPDDRRLVLPRRADGEAALVYAARITRAAGELRARAD